MILLYNIRTNDSIEFNEKTLLRNDDHFVSFELPKGFNWLDHTRDCSVCKQFLSEIENGTTSWYISIDNDWWMIDATSGFGDRRDNFLGHLSTTVKNGVPISLLKLRIRPVNKEFLERRLNEELEKENYEKCSIFRDILKHFPNKG